MECIFCEWCADLVQIFNQHYLLLVKAHAYVKVQINCFRIAETKLWMIWKAQQNCDFFERIFDQKTSKKTTSLCDSQEKGGTSLTFWDILDTST